MANARNKIAGPEGFDPTACGSEDRRDILTTLRALTVLGLPAISILIEIVMNPGSKLLPYTVMLGLRQMFCDHSDSFAYRRYDDYDFVEYSRCSKCGKVLKSIRGFDEDIRG